MSSNSGFRAAKKNWWGALVDKIGLNFVCDNFTYGQADSPAWSIRGGPDAADRVYEG
jgi:hypothetical protein